MNGESKIPKNLWKGLAIVLALMLLIAALLTTLVALGVFDPRPLGPVTVRRSLERIGVDQDSKPIHWLEEQQPGEDYSIRLAARLAGGESDIGYGLVLGTSKEALILAVSPLGYLTFWKQTERNGTTTEELYIPWLTWPHIHGGTGQNEIWLDVQQGQVTSIRVNQELLKFKSVPAPDEGIGLWSETFGSPAEISFDTLEIFSGSQ